MKRRSNLAIEYIPIGKIKPYWRNAKLHPDEQIGQIVRSIQEFGFNDPIAICNGEIVEGHGRYLAAKQLRMKELPCIRLDDLTDEQKRAYTLVHNKLTMNSGFDLDVLNAELLDISEVDMSEFDFEIDLGFDEPADTRDPSCQHNVFENQERMQFPTDSFYGMPMMQATQTVGDKFLRFADWKEVSDYENYIAHFFYDDYKFIAAWREPEKYIDRLRQFKAVVSPDFSVYTDFPRALQILACYRRQWCGAYWQSLGIDVIPDVIWGDRKSYDYCFDGVPKHSTVAVSSVGVKLDKDWNCDEGIFIQGYEEMLKRLEPTTILFYGDLIDGLQGNIIQIPSFYAEKREMLNERKAMKNGKR